VKGIVEYFLHGQIHAQDETDILRRRECSKKVVQSSPEQSRRKGRSHLVARSVLIVHERERREERQVCEPEGSAKWGPAYAKPLQQAWNRWFVSRSFSEGWRLFSTFPEEQETVCPLWDIRIVG